MSANASTTSTNDTTDINSVKIILYIFVFLPIFCLILSLILYLFYQNTGRFRCRNDECNIDTHSYASLPPNYSVVCAVEIQNDKLPTYEEAKSCRIIPLKSMK